MYGRFLLVHIQKKNPKGFELSAGEEGIEPSHGGTRTHCLTAWLLPNNVVAMTNHQNPITKKARI